MYELAGGICCSKGLRQECESVVGFNINLVMVVCKGYQFITGRMHNRIPLVVITAFVIGIDTSLEQNRWRLMQGEYAG